MVFLRYDVNSPRNAGNGLFYAILREKNELPWNVYIFLAFSFIFIQNMEMKKKTLKNPFSLRNIYFFIEMACISFYVTWKRDFLQNDVKTNKKV